jgi:hypothetical protein
MIRWLLLSALAGSLAGFQSAEPAVATDVQASAADRVKPARVSSTALVLGDAVNHFQGPYVAYAGDWSVRMGGVRLRHGVDYADSIVVEPATFPAGTEIRWSWPMATPPKGVYGYMHVAYGYYAGGVPHEPIPSRRIKDIAALKTVYRVAASQTSGGYNVLSETFLTSASGDFKTKLKEIGFLTEISRTGREFFGYSRALGQWRDPSGVTWSVAEAGGYYMFVPADGELEAGTLHYDEAFRWLTSRGELTGEEWFNGLAIGIEPVAGSGTARIEDWKIEYR